MKRSMRRVGTVFIDSFGKLPRDITVQKFIQEANRKFVCAIYQRVKNETMRGGAENAFDADMVAKIKEGKNWKDNEVFLTKNRYSEDISKKIKVH